MPRVAPRPAEPRLISELLAAGRSARGRSPGAARVREERTLAPAGAAPCSVIQAPLEDALE